MSLKVPSAARTAYSFVPVELRMVVRLMVFFFLAAMDPPDGESVPWRIAPGGRILHDRAWIRARRARAHSGSTFHMNLLCGIQLPVWGLLT
jgi:hypothetical protein